MMSRTLVILAALLVAAPASAMDLMDLYREASKHDARYAAARAQFRAMQEAVPQARAGVATNIRLDGALERYQDSVTGSRNFSFERRHR